MNYEIEIRPASKNAYFTPAESNQYYKSRYSRAGVCGHWWGDGSGADNHDAIVNYFLQQAEAGIKSVNFVVSDKKITQMVDPNDVAWCSQGGNPISISIECQPTLGDEGYKRLSWLIAYLDKKYGNRMTMYRHSDFFATTCCGSIDMNKARGLADQINGGSIPVTHTPAPNPTNQQITPSTALNMNASTVVLPRTVGSWALYKEGSQLRKGSSDQIGTLAPSVYGGLTYKIVKWVGDYAVVIDTQMFGRGVIWVKDTEAQFGGSTQGSATAGTPTPTGSATLILPGSVDSWRAYNTGGPWTPGHEIAFLRPKLFGGLEYPILGNPAKNIYIIKTQDFGQVAIYAGPDTEAQFK